jgi:sulfonate transport system permease protein
MNSIIQRIKHHDWRGYALPIGLLLLWALATQQGWVNTKLIVPPDKVLDVAWKELAKSNLYTGVAWSIGRDLAGLLLGLSAGIAVGVLLGVSTLADRLIGPTFHTVRQISLFAWLPLLSALVGTGDLSKVIFIAFSAFYPVVLGTLEGVKGVSLTHLEVARVYGFSRTQVLTRLILPSAAPQIAGGARLGLIYAWLATIGSEFLLVSEGNGIGSIVFRGRAAFNVELILFGLLIIGLIGAFFNRLANQAEQRLLPWRSPQR